MAKDIAVAKRTQLTWGLLVFLGMAPAQLLPNTLMTSPGPAGIHAVWMAGAILLGALLSAPRRCWAACIAGMLAGAITFTPISHSTAMHAAVVSVPTILFTPLAALVLIRISRDSFLFHNFQTFILFIVLVLIALPVLSSMGIYYISRYTEWKSTSGGGWINTGLAVSLGYAFYMPAWASFAGVKSEWRRRSISNGWLLLEGVIALIFVATSWYYLGSKDVLDALEFVIPVAVIVWASFVAGIAGTSFMVTCMTVIAVQLSLGMKGPFLESTTVRTMLGIQLWAWMLMVSATGLAVLLEQWSAGRALLVETHSEIRELAGRLIATRENERARLARDLHDDINQRLAAASIQLSMLRRKVAAEANDVVGEIQAQLMSLSDDVRHISHDLHPRTLKQTGLVAALDALCATQRDPYGPSISLRTEEGVDSLSDELALCFYRIVQEALANIMKHANAKHVYVRVSIDEIGANLWVIDDGVGFIQQDQKHGIPSGIGLVSMDERVKLLGGSFKVDTSPGNGVDLWIRVPLQKKE